MNATGFERTVMEFSPAPRGLALMRTTRRRSLDCDFARSAFAPMRRVRPDRIDAGRRTSAPAATCL
jgi:hypothetical protein